MAGFRLRVTLPSDNWSHLPSFYPYPDTVPTEHHIPSLSPDNIRSPPGTSSMRHHAASRRRNLCLLFTSFTLTFITLLYTLANPTLHGAGRLVEAGRTRLDGGLGLSRFDVWHGDGGRHEIAGSAGSGGWAHRVKEGLGLGLGWLPIEKIGSWGWDPAGPEEMDPKGCLRARQYRQVMRVLERERRAEHSHWWFTNTYNIQVFQNVSRCFLPTHHDDYTPCPDKPLIISGWWYSAEVVSGGTSGETIWQTSLVSGAVPTGNAQGVVPAEAEWMFKQIQSFGVNIACVGPYENWVEVAEMMPDVYRFIWNSDVDVVSCVTDPRCIAKEHYVPPLGAEDLSVGVPDEERGVIPIWMLQIVDYWGSRPKETSNNDHYWGLKHDGDWSYQPLGQQWIATPWALPGHVHLPYSIEEYCLPLPVKPHEERNNTVLIFAKRSAYFHWPHVSPMQFWTDLAREPTFDLLSTCDIEDGYPLPDGLDTIGLQSREAYEELVGSVKVMLGMGAPMISPSVYSSLCQATPVVIPTFWEGYSTEGWNLFAGWSQHGPAATIGPPYVYSYYSKNYTSLLEAVEQARTTPIDRYIPEDMRLTYALQAMESYLSRDLYAMFQAVLSSNGGHVPRLIEGARERCYELERCRDVFPEGRTPSTPENWESERERDGERSGVARVGDGSRRVGDGRKHTGSEDELGR